MARTRRRTRSPHPGVVLIPPEGTRLAWRARFVDPDTGRMVKVRLDPMAVSTAEGRRDWAIRKSKTLARRHMELEAGAPRAAGTTLEAAVGRYFEAHPRLRPKTVTAYRDAADHLVDWAKRSGVHTVDDLTRARLMGFREERIRAPRMRQSKGKRGTHKPSTQARSAHAINRELRSVRTVLGYLRKLDMLPRLSGDDLRDALERLPVSPERINYLHPADLRRLIEACLRHDAETFDATREEHRGEGEAGTTPRYEAIAPFVAFVLLTGMRLGEALTLDWQQVDLDALDHQGRKVGEIHLTTATTKTKRARTVDLEVSPALRRILAAQKLATGGKGRVFTELTEGVVNAARKRLRAEYGAPASFGWQALRRTCGTYLTNAPAIFGAASAYRSARQLGHSVQVAERHYLGLARGIPRDARDLETAMQIADLMERVAASSTPQKITRLGR